MIIKSNDIYEVPEMIQEKVAVRLKGVDHYGIDKELLLSDLSTLFLGSSGTGKSTVIKKCIAELTKNKQGTTIIFDLKGEYLASCFDPSTDVVRKHSDLFGVQDLISRNTNITSFGIKMEMRTVLMSIFVRGSNFCTSNSRFSIRDFVRNGHGNKLFIEYSFNERESSASIIRLLLDLAMKEALSRPCIAADSPIRINYIFDEFAFLSSGLKHLDALKEVGRSKGCRLYGGFQNFNQLMKMHDGRADLAAEELAGFSNVVSFNLHDKETIENLVGRSGIEECEITRIDALCNVLLPQLNIANNTCQIENFSASESLAIHEYSCGFLP